MLNLIIYMIVMAVTPGPNTLLSMANAASCGLRRGVRLNWGMLAGISIVTAVSFIASKALYAVIPSAETALKAIGAAYLVYLAVRMALKDGMGRSGEGCTFVEGMLLQLVNVKVYLLALCVCPAHMLHLRPYLGSRGRDAVNAVPQPREGDEHHIRHLPPLLRCQVIHLSRKALRTRP